jgi:hypothetical protein
MLRFFSSLVIAFFIVSCGGDDSTSTVSSYKSATITHGGFDFSADKSDPDYVDSDGETIGWADNMVYATGEGYETGVWYRSNERDSSNQKIYFYDTGATDLDSVTSVNTSLWMNATDTWPSLKVGHVYVTKTLDGYVKFKVLSTQITPEWQFEAQYKYSASTTF